MFFQDEWMSSVYAAHPEIIFIDTTYMLLELRLPVYIIIAFPVCEDTQTISWLIHTFKEQNPDRSCLWVVMADKDIKERENIKELFPDVIILIYLLHTLHSFDKTNITSGHKVVILNILQQLAYSISIKEYEKHYKNLMPASPESVREYYNDIWHKIKEEWLMGMKFESGNFLNNTNKRLESFNGKLKSVIDRYSSLEDFVDHFFIVLTSLQTKEILLLL